MGSFANIFIKDDAGIDPGKKKEFEDRLIRILDAGGGVRVVTTQLFGHEVHMFERPRVLESACCYVNTSTIERRSWEAISYEKNDGEIRSGKVGWGGPYGDLAIAAYTLEGLYSNKAAVALINGKPATNRKYVGWINYVLGTEYRFPNESPWEIYEAAHNDSDRNYWCEDVDRWLRFGKSIIGAEGFAAVYAAEFGCEKWLEIFKETPDEYDPESNFLFLPHHATNIINKILGMGSEAESVIGKIQEYFSFGSAQEASKTLSKEETLRDSVFMFLALFNLPQIVIRAAADACGKDFWELWRMVSEVYNPDIGVRMEACREDIPYTSTLDFFGVEPERLLPVWDERDGDIFPDWLKEWLRKLRQWHEKLKGKEQLSVREVYGLLHRADERCHEICFIEFFEGFIEETDAEARDRYNAAWLILKELLDEADSGKDTHGPLFPEGMDVKDAIAMYFAMLGNGTLREKVLGF